MTSQWFMCIVLVLCLISVIDSYIQDLHENLLCVDAAYLSKINFTTTTTTMLYYQHKKLDINVANGDLYQENMIIFLACIIIVRFRMPSLS